MLDIFLFIVVELVAMIVGAFGWSQIIGSFQNFNAGRIFTILLWIFIIVGVRYLCIHFFPNQIIALYIGYGLTLIFTLQAGKIE